MGQKIGKIKSKCLNKIFRKRCYMVCYVTSLFHLLRNIFSKNLSFTRALGVSFVSPPFPAPPLHLDVDLVHHGQKEPMDGHLGPNPDCPAFLRFSSGNNRSSSTYIVSPRILSFSLKNIGFIWLFICLLPYSTARAGVMPVYFITKSLAFLGWHIVNIQNIFLE